MILINGYVRSDTGNGIPYASLELLDEQLQSLGVGTVANGSGSFSFYADESLPAYYLKASSVGYKSVLEFTERLQPGSVLVMKKDIQVLQDVTVTSHTANKNNTLLFGLAALLLLTQKKKKLSGIGAFNTGTVVAVGAGLLMLKGFDFINNLLTSLGLSKGKGEKNVAEEQQNPYSPWKPAFWQSYQGEQRLITESGVQQYIQQIHNAFTVIQDDFNVIFGVFSKLKTQSQVSYLAYKFQQRYGEDLLSFLTDGGGILPWDGLSSSHLERITTLVNNLPQYL